MTTDAETAKNIVLKTKQRMRKHKKLDEMALKMLKALDRKEPKTKNSKM